MACCEHDARVRRLIRADEAERVPETGAVASVQEAELTLPRRLLEPSLEPRYLERLARAYWVTSAA